MYFTQKHDANMSTRVAGLKSDIARCRDGLSATKGGNGTRWGAFKTALDQLESTAVTTYDLLAVNDATANNLTTLRAHVHELRQAAFDYGWAQDKQGASGKELGRVQFAKSVYEALKSDAVEKSFH